MTFEKTPRGTYGQNMPPFLAPVVKLGNSFMVGRARRTQGSMMGMNVLVLTTIGAKTGHRRESVLGYFPDGQGNWLIVASAGGSAANPAWYHNLAAHPDQAEIELKGQKIPVTATQLSGDERAAAWQQVITTLPRYAGYATKTDRQIPILRLTPR